VDPGEAREFRNSQVVIADVLEDGVSADVLHFPHIYSVRVASLSRVFQKLLTISLRPPYIELYQDTSMITTAWDKTKEKDAFQGIRRRRQNGPKNDRREREKYEKRKRKYA
jgi:negative regulator of sigma E activity